MLIVCVDGGQTKTAVDVFDDDGRLVQQWLEEPIIFYARPGGLERYYLIASNVCGKLNEIHAGRPVSLCFSMSGYLGDVPDIPRAIEDGLSGRRFQLVRLQVVPDSLGNWYSVTKGDPGIVLIAGGGTVAYGRSRDGRSLRLGGWGHMLGDEGSGYWIGLESVKAVLQSQAGIAAPTSMERPIWEALGMPGERELMAGVNSGGITDKAFALLVPVVDSCAAQDDPAACRIMKSAAWHLYELVSAAIRDLGDVPVYLSGGVFNASVLMEHLNRKFVEGGILERVHYAEVRPTEGIYRIAKEAAADSMPQ